MLHAAFAAANAAVATLLCSADAFMQCFPQEPDQEIPVSSGLLLRGLRGGSRCIASAVATAANSGAAVAATGAVVADYAAAVQEDAAAVPEDAAAVRSG
jgi:hypothetical protein